MAKTILLTSAKEDSEKIIQFFDQQGVQSLHLPLEVYKPRNDVTEIKQVLNNLDEYATIAYGSKRNAIYFWDQLQVYGEAERAKECLNLVRDEATFNFLDTKGIPAVQSPHGRLAIDLVEMLLRFQRYSKVLYPCGMQRSEDLPRLLEELDIQVTELPVFELKGPAKREIESMRQKVKTASIDSIIFHSRRSVTRTLAAFPSLDFTKMDVIAADAGTSQKLQEKDITADSEAKGSWKSIMELL